MRIGDYLSIEDGDVSCATCGEGLATVDDHIKKNLMVSEDPISNAGPYYDDPSRFVSEEMVFREFYCPGCGTMLFNQTARRGDPVLKEFDVVPDVSED